MICLKTESRESISSGPGIRLCDAHASERQLLSVIYNYTITGTFNGTMWSPFGNAPHVDPTLGATGAPIYPDASGYRNNPMASGYQPAPTGAAFGGRSVVPQVAPRRPAPTSVPQAPVLPAPVGPRVPSPDLPQLSPQATTVPDHEQQQARGHCCDRSLTNLLGRSGHDGRLPEIMETDRGVHRSDPSVLKEGSCARREA